MVIQPLKYRRVKVKFEQLFLNGLVITNSSKYDIVLTFSFENGQSQTYSQTVYTPK